MHPVIAKTFGGLSTAYYFRNLFFGLLFPALILAMVNEGDQPLGAPLPMIVLFTINAILYPYSRFVYEGVIGFIVGENVFVVSGLLPLLVKFMTMAICWSAAIFVAPIGLIYLYFHHSRRGA